MRQIYDEQRPHRWQARKRWIVGSRGEGSKGCPVGSDRGIVILQCYDLERLERSEMSAFALASSDVALEVPNGDVCALCDEE